MLIGICGSSCSGKTTVARFLIEEHGFQELVYVPSESQNSASGVSRTGSASSYKDLAELLDFVTVNWRQRWLLADAGSHDLLETLSRRPYFLLVCIDAPLITRWQRLVAKRMSAGATPPSLEDFAKRSDGELYRPVIGLAHLADRAQLRLLNSGSSVVELHGVLDALDLTNEQRLRPNWDQYFMQLADLASQRSNCMKRRVGCVLVQNNRVISTGYNGTPRGIRNCNEGGCERCNSGQGAGYGYCLCIHAEENALLEAGRERIRHGAILYCDTCPCLTCSIKITQVGISEVVYNQGYRMDEKSAAVFEEAGVKLRQFSPPREGLIDLDSYSQRPARLVRLPTDDLIVGMEH